MNRNLLGIILFAAAALVAVWWISARANGATAGTPLAGTPLVAAAQAAEAPAADPAGERFLGRKDAPVTIIDYSSLTCPHCATFHNETLPKLEEQYFDTGKAKLVFRDFPFDQWALRAAMMARCAPEERYFKVLDVLFERQGQWSRAADPGKILMQLGTLAGLPKATIEACWANETLADAILTMRMKGQNEHKVEATPTFILTGPGGETARIEGAQSFERFAEAIEKLAP